MSKQKLIDELERISLDSHHKALMHPESKNYYKGMAMAYSQVVYMVNTMLKPDEPQKVVVPQFVADWIEGGKKKGFTLWGALRAEDIELFSDYDHMMKCESWVINYPNNQEMFASAWIHGYEVKKLIWRVKIGKVYLKEPLGDTSDSTISTTWDKKCAYPFDSFHVADKHATKFGGKVEEVAEG